MLLLPSDRKSLRTSDAKEAIAAPQLNPIWVAPIDGRVLTALLNVLLTFRRPDLFLLRTGTLL